MGLFGRNHSTVEDQIDAATDTGRRALKGISKQADSAADVTGEHMRNILDDLEAVIDSGKDAVDAKALQKTVRAKLKTARRQFDDPRLAKRLNCTVSQVRDRVHAQPLQSLGAVAGAALVIGFLAGRV
ncbi:MAG: DUF883 family protein [Janthinobacterium lividum]